MNQPKPDKFKNIEYYVMIGLALFCLAQEPDLSKRYGFPLVMYGLGILSACYLYSKRRK